MINVRESLDKSHLHLYGYGKKTTPLLDSLSQEGRLCAFDNVKSSVVSTVPAFRRMMTSLTKETQGIDWKKQQMLRIYFGEEQPLSTNEITCRAFIRCAIVVYLPDDSLDIFDSSEDYAGHARDNPQSLAAGMNIPFIIYATDEFCSLHLDLIKRFHNTIHNNIESQDLMHAIMDILSVDFVGNRRGMVEKHPLFTEFQ